MKNVNHLVKQWAAKSLELFGNTLNKHKDTTKYVLLKFGEGAWTAALVGLFFEEPVINALLLLVVGVTCTLLSRKI
ncbi:hypothetical protein [Photobacterium lutimaris]|uniref:Uncharacterized protein n=1 Tax=Photobacterium lutimaris TaxID=388278 RepID=A0A2T3ITT1_9GAMM|nr:hypothetical protein [Photobacterium lutimaris]PSU31752.1 hypothetical protein C9I99_21450 [Photobacterium lutimaris]TDR72598.1 hypothetical protein DFP78_11374 [Photobacterium lutimaris]